MSETILITFPLLMKGLWLTFKISMWTIVLGSFLGFVIGLIRASRLKILKAALGVYIHCLRGTPFLVQLYLIYFVLPATGVEWLKFEAFPAAVIALSLYTSAYVSEIVRAGIEAVPKGQVEAARALGASDRRIMVFHIWRNILGPVVVLATLDMGLIILGIAGLSFLGLGVQPPTPEWGAMLNDARPYLQTAPRLLLAPGISIFLLVLGFNLLGDGLRDILDPTTYRD